MRTEDLVTARFARNYVAGLVKNAKREYIVDNMNANHNNHKKFWDNIHRLHAHKQDEPNISLKKHDTSNPISDQNTPYFVSDFFVNIGTKLANNHPFNKDTYAFHGHEYPEVFDIHPVDHTIVQKEISNLQIGKPTSIDNISTKIRKDALLALLNQFTYLINLSISHKTFPDKWKIAKVSPIHKDGDRTLVSIYGSISVLPVPSMILERLVQIQLFEYLENTNILDVNQGGFRKNYSTTSITCSLLDNVYLNMNNQKLTHAILVDFCKAFDSINHELILFKLWKCGVTNNSIKWFESYLHGRKQMTIVNKIF